MRRYVTDDDWFVVPQSRAITVACCDCGLVHRWYVRRVPHVNRRGTLIVMRLEVDARATAAVRRERRKRGVK